MIPKYHTTTLNLVNYEHFCRYLHNITLEICCVVNFEWCNDEIDYIDIELKSVILRGLDNESIELFSNLSDNSKQIIIEELRQNFDSDYYYEQAK